MSVDQPPIWLVLTCILLLFVSGAWTLATVAPFSLSETVRSAMLVTTTTANIFFLLSLLAVMVLHSGMGSEERLRKAIVIAFSIAIIALIISIILFSASFLMKSPPHYQD